MQKRKYWIIIISVAILCCAFTLWQIITGNLNSPYTYVLYAVSILTCLFLLFCEKKIRHNNSNLTKVSYNNFDVVRYLFSIVIIILHLRPVQYDVPALDIFINNILGRVCVPFFFLTTGYFVAKKQTQDSNYLSQYLKSVCKLYLVWCLLYLPIVLTHALEYKNIIISYFQNFSDNPIIIILSIILTLPLILFVGIIYTGTYYHLWYFPAVIIALWLANFVRKKLKITTLLIVSFLFLLFGATETYYGVLPSNIQSVLSLYFYYFYTTRNFLFFGFFYVVFGFYLASKPYYNANFCSLKLLFSFVLLIIEAVLLQPTNRINSNIMMASIPVTYYLFVCCLSLPAPTFTKQIRDLSKYYYLIHPAIIFVFQLIIRTFSLAINNVIFTFIILLTTHLLSKILIQVKNQKPNLII